MVCPLCTRIRYTLKLKSVDCLFHISDNVDYYINKEKFEELETGLSQMSTIQGSSVDFWMAGFTRWLNTTTPGLNLTGQLNTGKVSDF